MSDAKSIVDKLWRRPRRRPLRSMADILVVDDEESIAAAFRVFLADEGHEFRIASSADEALRLIAERPPNIAFMDVRMPGRDGVQALQTVRANHPQVYVVMMTAYGTSQTSIDSIRAGAFEYLTKPLDLDQLRAVIRQAIAAKDSRTQAATSEREREPQPLVALVGDTPVMQELYKLIGRLATNNVPALVVGERGTGKELVAATIHHNSARRDAPFVTVNCAVTPEAALEAELFGDHTGTLHLAAVHALPRTLQDRLRRALEQQDGAGGRGLAARVIASTEENLLARVGDGTFTRELYEVLAVVTITVPPLRERRDDIPLLVRHFIQRYNEELNRTIRSVDERVLQRFQEYEWPGNVGELASVMKRACIVTGSDVITMQDIGESLSTGRMPGRQDLESALSRAARLALQERLVESDGSSSPFHEIVDIVEATLVREALTITKGNQVKASELLGVNRATLRKKATAES